MNKKEILGLCEFLKLHGYENTDNISKFIFGLQQENKQLKAQIEEYQKDIKDLDNQNKRAFENMQLNQLKVCNMIKQQKEFIKYLEDKIYSIEPKGTDINYNCEYDSEEDYVIAMQEQSRLNTLKEILQKYKSIIGEK